MWLAYNGAFVISVAQNDVGVTAWGTKVLLTSLVASMTVNALVTGLIVFRIFRVFGEVGKRVTTLEDKSSDSTHGNKLRSVPFIIIESGIVLFAIQLARVAIEVGLTTGPETDAALYAFEFIAAIHTMVNVIISSVIATLCLLIMSI